MATVCVSWVPGSVKLPLTVVEPFSLMVAGEAPAMTSVGATLLTVMSSVPEVDPLSSSATVTEIVYRSDVVPVGLSSRYWWLA